MQHFMQYKTKNALKLIDFVLNMAVGGFEPRYVAVYTLSRRAPSATRTPHHIVLLLTLGGQRGATIGSCVKTVKHIFFFLCRSLTQ